MKRRFLALMLVPVMLLALLGMGLSEDGQPDTAPQTETTETREELSPAPEAAAGEPDTDENAGGDNDAGNTTDADTQEDTPADTEPSGDAQDDAPVSDSSTDAGTQDDAPADTEPSGDAQNDAPASDNTADAGTGSSAH